VRLRLNLPAFVERSLRRKVTALVLAITVLSLGLAAGALMFYDLRAYERQFSSDLLTQAEVLGRAAAPALSFNDPRTAEKDLSVMQARPRVLAAALYTREGRLFATYTRPRVTAPAFPVSAAAEGYAIADGRMEVYKSVAENNERVGTVYILGVYDPWDHLKDYLAILLLVMVASLAVAAFLSGWLQAAVTAPILEVASVSHQVMEKRDYSLRVHRTTADEIGELVDAFNAMLAEIGRRAEALRSADQRKDEFLATLAHELRNPLAPIRNALEILRLAGNDPVKAEKAREMMQRQVGQLVRLVDDLIDVSRITTGKLAVRKVVFDLRSALRDAVETARPFIDSRRHALDVRLPREPLPVDGDTTRLAQVFSNLLNNAAKYTEPGGRIELTAGREGKEIVVSVSDNGIGLAADSIPLIFDMFMQVDRSLDRAQAGLGVGLTLSRTLVELHQGTIEVASPGKGQGSTFTVHLPASYTRLEDATGPAGRGANETPGKRVLLADDNADFVNSLGQLLTSRGHEVRIAYDGAEALEAAREFRPEVAFLDIGMPKVHGYDVARRLRDEAATAHCMLVAVTGWGQEGDRAQARAAGFDRHLVKPVDPSEIEAILESRA
jgi:signal transduction histidine kinase/CheY-like chemotaxis protein